MVYRHKKKKEKDTSRKRAAAIARRGARARARSGPAAFLWLCARGRCAAPYRQQHTQQEWERSAHELPSRHRLLFSFFSIERRITESERLSYNTTATEFCVIGIYGGAHHFFFLSSPSTPAQSPADITRGPFAMTLLVVIPRQTSNNPQFSPAAIHFLFFFEIWIWRARKIWFYNKFKSPEWAGGSALQPSGHVYFQGWFLILLTPECYCHISSLFYTRLTSPYLGQESCTVLLCVPSFDIFYFTFLRLIFIFSEVHKTSEGETCSHRDKLNLFFLESSKSPKWDPSDNHLFWGERRVCRVPPLLGHCKPAPDIILSGCHFRDSLRCV